MLMRRLSQNASGLKFKEEIEKLIKRDDQEDGANNEEALKLAISKLEQ